MGSLDFTGCYYVMASNNGDSSTFEPTPQPGGDCLTATSDLDSDSLGLGLGLGLVLTQLIGRSVG
jgi:hypothetical protein